MFHIRGFRAYRYALGDDQEQDLSALQCPPYDVIGPEQRKKLSGLHPHNAANVELPEGSDELEDPDNRYGNAARIWQQWKDQGVVVQDQHPAFYVLEQDFENEGQQYSRIAIVAEAKLHDFSDMVILPHEHTLPKALGDRFRLLKATGVNFSLVFGLYSVPDQDAYDSLIGEMLALEPVSYGTDTDGVLTKLRIVDDPSLMARFAALVEGRQVFLADGHHRYTVALGYRNGCREKGAVDPEAGSEYVLMGLCNMEDPQLLVLPYDRAVNPGEDFDPERFLEGLQENFTITEPEGPLEDYPQDRIVFDIVLRQGEACKTYRVALKEDKDLDTLIQGDHSSPWKHLDVAVVQELVLAPFFGVDTGKQETLDQVVFSRTPSRLIRLVQEGECQVAFLLRAARMDQLRAVSLAGETMPQKSTYFYPKLPTGFVFRQLDE